MNRIDRAIGILLMLRSQKTVSAQALARRYEVSTRTIYRDVETLAELGIPVYAQMGRLGGFRLVDGYFMPPVMFNFREALSLLLGLTFLKGLRARPFAAEIDSTERKLLAALPDALRGQLERAPEIIGLEQLPPDLLHPERDDPHARSGLDAEEEGRIVSDFLSAVVEQRALEVRYHTPYMTAQTRFTALPAGVIWDRERWYLVIHRPGKTGTRTLRADRVRGLAPAAQPIEGFPSADVRTLLDRHWLKGAMAGWAEGSPVRIRMSLANARLLMRDWYYRHALFEPDGEAHLVMSIGEDDARAVLALVRWLGPDAELLGPPAWRAKLHAELETMEARHR